MKFKLIYYIGENKSEYHFDTLLDVQSYIANRGLKKEDYQIWEKVEV
jgi:hypothetical protein